MSADILQVMLVLRNQVKLYHWQTFEYARHKATDDLVSSLDDNIDKFTEFPKAISARKDELMDKTLVSFCTGGIRCEKSGLYMREIGMQHSYQLEGGILKYVY
jgi:rhodanese-related sulfurtransferase